MNITIGKASESDITPINDLLCQAFHIDPNATLATDFLNHNGVHCFIAKEANTILGTATLFVLQKTNRRVGLIEDVAVSEEARGKGIGKKLVEKIIAASKELGCYKTILNCPEKNVPFYEKLGFKTKEVQLDIRH